MAAHAILSEFEQARDDIIANPAALALWQLIIGKYPPTFLGQCKQAIDWSQEMVTNWLITGMFLNEPDAGPKARQVVTELGDHATTKSHARHLSMERAREIGLYVDALEDDADLQEAVLSVHHACLTTLGQEPIKKFIENQHGVMFTTGMTLAK